MQRMRHHGQRRIELEMSLPAAGGDGVCERLHVQPHLHQHLAHHRVDLARHDRGAGLRGRQTQFRETCARTRGEQADIVGHLGHARRHSRQVSGYFHAIVARGLGLEVVACLVEGEARFVCEYPAHASAEFRRCIDSGAHGRPADGEFSQHSGGALHTRAGFPELCGIAGKFLAQREGRGVHQMGAADLHDAGKLDGLRFQSRGHGGQCGSQIGTQHLHHADVQGARDDIVRRLAEIDVVIRVQLGSRAGGIPGELRGAGDDHFIRVRVGRGGGT